MNEKLEIFDLEVAIKQAGNDEALANELFEMLLNELPGYQQKIDTYCKDGDRKNLIEAVHKLNGATRYTGVPALSIAANQFEQALRSDTTDNYDDLCSQLINEIQRLKDAYPKQ